MPKQTPPTNPDVAESALVSDVRMCVTHLEAQATKFNKLNQEFSEYVKKAEHLAVFEPVVEVKTPRIFTFYLKTVTWFLGVFTATAVLMTVLAFATDECQIAQDQNGRNIAMICDLNTP